MPAWLRQLLEADGQFQMSEENSRMTKQTKIRIIENQVSGIVAVVERLLRQDHTTEYAYTCHPCVQHVSKLQNAWDLGINAQGRLETGGIRGTRKYIGTPEVTVK